MNAKYAGFLLLAAALVTCNGWAQSSGSAGAQASASTDVQASAKKKQANAQASGNSSANASAQADKNSAGLASGTTFGAVLSHSVDAKKNKPGDEVTARSTQAAKSDGKVVIPKGSKLVGHVTEAKARTKGESESALGIMFDRAILKDGREVPLHVAIQAVSAAQSQAALSGGDDQLMSPMGGGSASGSGRASSSGRASGSGGGLLSGATSTAGAATGVVTQTTGSVGQAAGGTVGGTLNSATSATAGNGGLGANGLLSSTSSGVFGLQGMTLNSQASNATQGSLLVSSTRNVHLDSGTQMMLRAENQPAQPQ
jgi:type IV secretory pathway VirB10-like protein